MGNQLNFQVASTPSYGDFAVKNYSTTVTIPSNVFVVCDTTNVLGAVSSADGIGVMLPSGDGTQVGIGITMESIAPGATGRIRSLGTAVTTADGAITAGGFVQATNDSNKVGFAKALAANATASGVALNTAADGDPCLVLLGRSVTKTT